MLKNILENTINLTKNNLEKTIFNNLELKLEIKKNFILDKDFERLNYLSEQSMIAKELDISDNQVDNFNLSQSNVLFNISTTDVAYYLRGYKAIDKEIELSESRDNFNYKFF